MDGTINEGKLANLVLLKQNPLEDIRNTKSIEGVMLQGKWLSREELDKMLLIFLCIAKFFCQDCNNSLAFVSKQ